MSWYYSEKKFFNRKVEFSGLGGQTLLGRIKIWRGSLLGKLFPVGGMREGYYDICTMYRYFACEIYVKYIYRSISLSTHLPICSSVHATMCALCVYFVCILCMDLGVILCIYTVKNRLDKYCQSKGVMFSTNIDFVDIYTLSVLLKSERV